MTDLARSCDALLERLSGRTREQGRDWFAKQREKIREDPKAIEVAFPGVGRRLGRGPLLEFGLDEPVRLSGTEGPILNPWTVADAARAVLVLEDASRDPDGAVERANGLYFLGSGDERTGVLRALQLLPLTEEALPAVRDALRVNAVDLFAAAVCENLYTSAVLPEDLFNQAVLKCLFVGLRIDRIERLEERTTRELVRMLFSYVTEREHAGRPIPVEVWPILALHPPEGTEERIRSRAAVAKDSYEKQVLDLALSRLGS